MSEAFASFNGEDWNTFSPKLTQVIGRQVQPITGFKPQWKLYTAPDALLQQFRNLTQWWNLDRNETARRTLIDCVIYAAFDRKYNNLIVTPEETIDADMNHLGNGRLDYLLSALQPGGIPIYTPSIVIEAKRMAVKGYHQVLAEMFTLYQIQAPKNSILHGIETDGQLWTFYEVQFATGYLFSSITYDFAAYPNDVFTFLAKMTENYNSQNDWTSW
jgi:hypothetical protein